MEFKLVFKTVINFRCVHVVLFLYEASGKLNHLRTHYASHYFVNSAVAASCKSFIDSVMTKKNLFDVFVVSFKHLYSY